MSTKDENPVQAVVLGTDALLAARPVSPLRLFQACFQAGYDFAAPASWGEELLAQRLAGVALETGGGHFLAAHCPYTVESIRQQRYDVPVVASVPPPVATARYLRAAFHPRAVVVTYVGSCPGAVSREIERAVLPDVFLASLVDSGIDAAGLSAEFVDRVPPLRSRYASIPGGMPAAAPLGSSGAMVVEVTPATIEASALMHQGGPTTILDLGAACGCSCSRDRHEAARLEPPRSAWAVVLAPEVDLTDGDRLHPSPGDRSDSPPAQDADASFGAPAPRAMFFESALTNSAIELWVNPPTHQAATSHNQEAF